MKISSDFDSGNIEVIDASDPQQVLLAIRPDSKSHHFQWFHFKVEGMTPGQRHGFSLTNAGQSAYSHAWTGYNAAADTVFVAVTDNGPGIPPEHLPRIFNIFESTKGARGTGLGLAVSQKILREHGGEITVESKPGEGCQFILCWPRLDEDHRPAERPTQG